MVTYKIQAAFWPKWDGEGEPTGPVFWEDEPDAAFGSKEAAAEGLAAMCAAGDLDPTHFRVWLDGNPYAYPEWTPSYAHEAFDRAQSLADVLTARDRAEGRRAPEFGYSAERFAEAKAIVDGARR